MKAVVTVIDDNEKVVCKDLVFPSCHESVSSDLYYPPIKEVRFSFVVRQLIDTKLRLEPYNTVRKDRI